MAGVAAITVPDNLKAGVTKACWYDPELNPSYAELARHYDTVVLPARARRPRDKAAAEAGVLAVERWVLAPLRNRRFYSRAELNEAIADQVAKLNARAFRGEPASRAELFAELERPALRPLPAGPLRAGPWRKATVHIDYHVEAGDGHFYSVPVPLRPPARWSCGSRPTTVEVFRGRQAHRQPPPASTAGAAMSPTRPTCPPVAPGPCWSGPPTADRLGGRSPRAAASWWSSCWPPAPSRARLPGLPGDHEPGPTLRATNACRAACARAVASGAISYSSVKSILAESLDRLPLPEPARCPAPPEPRQPARGRLLRRTGGVSGCS